MDAPNTGAGLGVNTDADTVWLTYSELGKARGTNAAAAKRLAMRRRWRRQPGNDGTTRVCVPVSEAQTYKRPDKASTGVNTEVNTTSVIKVLEDAVASLTDRAIAAENRADRAEIRAESAEKRANDAEKALAEERKRADRLELGHDRLETERDEAEARANEAAAAAQAAQDAAEELRRASEARAGQGRWARLRAAWRGGERRG